MSQIVKLTAVDIFAGAGGLSLGARRAGFDVRVAVELDADVAATYRCNHPDIAVLERDVRQLTGEGLLTMIPERRIDLLMGCAPCQGFCSLTSKRRREDPRNELVIEMARIVEETRPGAVLMENVPGLAIRGRRLLEAFLVRLRAAGYLPQWWTVQMADYGVPQNRRRLVLLAGRGFAIPLPRPTHGDVREPGRRVKPWKTLRDAIYGEKPPPPLSRAHVLGGPRALNWHVVRDLHPETKARLLAAMPGRTRLELDDELLPNCHRGGYKGFRNVYMRMVWDEVASTITAGCTTPAKGRFGHPDRRRTTISVREAATIQTFPKSFRLATDKIDVACELVGNAVPPLFAERLARQARHFLRTYHATVGRQT